MKKLLSSLTFRAVRICAAALAFSANVVAAPLDTRGIPADTNAVYHFDLDACAKNQPEIQAPHLLGSYYFGIVPIPTETFQKETGINLQTDLHSLTLGIIALGENEKKNLGKTNEKELSTFGPYCSRR